MTKYSCRRNTKRHFNNLTQREKFNLYFKYNKGKPLFDTRKLNERERDMIERDLPSFLRG